MAYLLLEGGQGPPVKEGLPGERRADEATGLLDPLRALLVVSGDAQVGCGSRDSGECLRLMHDLPQPPAFCWETAPCFQPGEASEDLI